MTWRILKYSLLVVFLLSVNLSGTQSVNEEDNLDLTFKPLEEFLSREELLHIIKALKLDVDKIKDIDEITEELDIAEVFTRLIFPRPNLLQNPFEPEPIEPNPSEPEPIEPTPSDPEPIEP